MLFVHSILFHILYPIHLFFLFYPHIFSHSYSIYFYILYIFIYIYSTFIFFPFSLARCCSLLLAPRIAVGLPQELSLRSVQPGASTSKFHLRAAQVTSPCRPHDPRSIAQKWWDKWWKITRNVHRWEMHKVSFLKFPCFTRHLWHDQHPELIISGFNFQNEPNKITK